MDLTKIIPNFELATVVVKGDKRVVSKASFTIEEDGQVAFDFDKMQAKEKGTHGLGERQKLVFDYLQREFPKGATAKELSVELYQEGLVPSSERNSVHPRLNELIALGLVKVVGKKTCQFTDRSVSIYKVI